MSTILTGLFAIHIISLRVTRLRRERRERDFARVWQPLLEQAAENDDALTLPKLQTREHIFFLKLWNHLQETSRGDAVIRLNQIAARLGCYGMAHRMLHGAGRTRQLLAIMTLGRLRDRTAWHDLMAEVIHDDNVASLCALRALVQIDTAAVMRELTPLMLSRDDWPAVRLIAILQDESLQIEMPLFQAAVNGQLKQRLKALRIIEGLHLSLPLPMLAPLLDGNNEPELIAAALRATFYPQLLSSVRALISHSDWRVRVQAVKAIGRIGHASDMQRLAKALADSEWWVRYRAAQTLANMPSFHRSLFDTLLAATNDRYAHDMLNQVLAEKGML